MLKYSFKTKAGIQILLSRKSFFVIENPPFLQGRYSVVKHWDLGLKDFELLLFHGDFYLVEYIHQIDFVSSLR